MIILIDNVQAEIVTMNTDEFKWGVNWQQVSTSLELNIVKLDYKQTLRNLKDDMMF